MPVPQLLAWLVLVFYTAGLLLVSASTERVGFSVILAASVTSLATSIWYLDVIFSALFFLLCAVNVYALFLRCKSDDRIVPEEDYNQQL